MVGRIMKRSCKAILNTDQHTETMIGATPQVLRFQTRHKKGRKERC